MGLSHDVPREVGREARVKPARKAGRSARIVLPIGGLAPGVGDVATDGCGVLMVELARRFATNDRAPVTRSDEVAGFMDDVRAAMLRRTLSAGFPRTTVVWLSARRDTPWAVGSALRAAIKSGRLVPLHWTADAARQMASRGVDRVTKDLGICGLRRREALLVEACAPWLDDAADARALAGHAVALLSACRRLHQGPVLGLIPASFRGDSLIHHIEQLTADEVPGAPWSLATLYAEDGTHPVVQIHHWPAMDGTSVHQRVFGLVGRRLGGRGKVGWQADGSAVAMDAQVLLDADDATRVIAVASVVQSRFGPPAGWEIVDNADEIEPLCQHAVAATVILPYAQVDEFAALAHRIHRLRAAHPRALKILVRELGERLRHGQEAVLLRLGANQVIYRDVSLSRMEQAVEELRDRLFTRPLVPESQPLIDAIAAEPVRGYLPPQSFCATARRMLARGLDAKLGHSLLTLPLRPSVAHLDALSAFQFERDGDLVTAGANEITLFLYGCQQADAQGTLSRLLRVPVTEIASQITLVTATIDINMALEALAAQAHVSPPPDWTNVLKARARPSEPTWPATAAAPSRPPSGLPPASPGEPVSLGDVRDGLQLPPGTRVLTPYVLPVRERVR